MNGLKSVRTEVLLNPGTASSLRLPRPKSADERITISAGRQKYSVRVAAGQLLLQREGGQLRAFSELCTVGREYSSDNDLTVADDQLSRTHFSVVLQDIYLQVIDHRSLDGTVVEWKDRLGRISARFSRNDPDLKLIIDRNQVLLEAVWEERSFIDLVKLGVMAGGELVKAHDDEPGHVVTVERYEGRLRIVTASDDLSDHLLSIAHKSIEQFNLGRIN